MTIERKLYLSLIVIALGSASLEGSGMLLNVSLGLAAGYSLALYHSRIFGKARKESLEEGEDG